MLRKKLFAVLLVSAMTTAMMGNVAYAAADDELDDYSGVKVACIVKQNPMFIGLIWAQQLKSGQMKTMQQ